MSRNGDVGMQGVENLSSSFCPEAINFPYPGNSMPFPTLLLKYCCPLLRYEKMKLTSPQFLLSWTVWTMYKSSEMLCSVCYLEEIHKAGSKSNDPL